MKRSQINGDVWVIPETKNGKPHTIYLSALAQQIIAGQKSGEFVFESVRSADQPILPSSITRALNRLQERALPDLEPFTVHDLRRSAATNWAEHLGAEERVIEICLNHQPMNKLIRIYHSSKHEDKTRALWQAWGEMVEELVAK